MKSGQVSKRDSSRRFTDEDIRTAFQTFDIDKNMFIGPSEIRHILSLMGEPVTSEEIDEMIRICDIDKSGLVSFDAFYRFFSSSDDASVSRGDSAMAVNSSMAKFSGSINDSDLNKTSMSDLIWDFCRSTDINPQFVKRVYKNVQEIDRGHSGRIGYREFLKVLDAEESPLAKKLFDTFDAHLLNEIDVKHFLVNLIIHSKTIKPAEKLKISFSMMRAPTCPPNSMDRASMKDLLFTFFSGFPEAGSKVIILDRVERAFSSAGGDDYISFDQFMDLVRLNPELVLPPLLLGNVF
jgi:Ca2+-binding EF-hand superfamily protein